MPLKGSYVDFNPTSAPVGAEGRVYYDSTNKKLYYHNGSAWVGVGPEAAASYIIFQSNGEILAQDGHTGDIKFRGVDASTVIQSAINDMQEGGKVVLKKGVYNITSKLTFYGGISLYCERNAILKNELTDQYAEFLEFRQYSNCERLEADCNNKSGVVFGELEKSNNIHVGYALIYNVGKVFVSETQHHFGIWVKGYNFAYDFVQVIGGNRAVRLEECSDCFGAGLLVVDFVTGLVLTSCEHIFLDSCDLDSGQYVGLQIDSSHDIHISGSVWNNQTAYPSNTLTYGALIGEYSSTYPNKLLTLDMQFIRHGGTAMKISNTEDSKFNVKISNASLYTTSPAIEKGIVYGTGLGTNLEIRGSMRDIATRVEGTVVGVLDMKGVGWNTGTATFSGDDVTTSFTIPHGLVATPNFVKLEARTGDAAGDKFWDADNTNITVTFLNAPPSGTDNVQLSWYASI